MRKPTILIDTNIFIEIDGEVSVPERASNLTRITGKHGIGVFIHEASEKDLARDKNSARREISLSKLRKFPVIRNPKNTSAPLLESIFGRIRNENDSVDCHLLYSLHIDAADFLVTEDQGIHDRVKASPLSSRVLTIADALSWLRATYEPLNVSLPFIEDVSAHEIPAKDAIFDTLKHDYPAFDDWWKKCVREHRKCWIATTAGGTAGIIVRKDETSTEAGTTLPGEKVLKLCTFKVASEYRGEKLGELLLKQSLWFAQRNNYDTIYLTTYPKQRSLVRMLEYFGFSKTRLLPDGEAYYEKPISPNRLSCRISDDVFEVDRLNYPRFVSEAPVESFVVPIRADYHFKLFPEIGNIDHAPLFPELGNLHRSHRYGTPGNAIRKTYLCRSSTSSMRPGSILLFYQSKNASYIRSQSITSVGIVEAVNKAKSLELLLRLSAKRSVFSETELEEMAPTEDSPVKVIDFLLAGHLTSSIPLDVLLQDLTLNAPPQSITKVRTTAFRSWAAKLDTGYEL